MRRERFYEVPQAAWLFAATPEPSDTRLQREELVRQWCAHELIRAYGVRVSDLSFEHVARVGSKSYRIDILIQRSGRPFAVVECKEPNYRRHDHAIAQAISYASVREIGCEFVLYTNGDTWLVRRRIGQDWTSVLDLPSVDEAANGGLIDSLLLTLESVMPILAVLDEPLVGEQARTLLGGLQKFFGGTNLLTEHFDHELVYATDNLLRVLWAPRIDEPYRLGKFTAASSLVETFRKRSGCGCEIISDYRNVESIFWFSELGGALHTLCGEPSRGTSPDWHLLRFFRALLHYGRKLDQARGVFPAIPPEVWHTLRAVLEFGFLRGIGIRLPDPLATKTDSDMKLLCRSAWERLILDERTEE